MRTLRWGASTVAIAAVLAFASGTAMAGGDINFDPQDKKAAATAPARKTDAATLFSNTWIGDLVGRLIASDQTPATRAVRIAKPRAAPKQTHAANAAPAHANLPKAATTATPQQPPAKAVAAPEPAPAPEQSKAVALPDPQKAAPSPSILTKPAESAPITTGTLPVPQRPATADNSRIDPADPSAHVITEAERIQARLDLVKLELASRTYDETRLAGQSAFDVRTDWRVLERAHDSLSAAELAVAESSGFEANAYINEVDKIIVVAIAGTQDLKHGFLEESLWRALIQSQAPQQFFLAKSYTRSIIQRYQMQGFTTECVGHSLGGGACAYAASELGIRAIVINPISAGPLAQIARHLVTNYIVDGDIASIVYPKRGNEISGEVQTIATGSEEARQRVIQRFGLLAGPILVVRSLRDSVRVHQIDKALDLLAAHAGTQRVR